MYADARAVGDVAMNPVANAFHRAAHSYAQHSQLQQRVGDDLLRVMQPILEPSRILDVGCGSGEFTQTLCKQWPQAQIAALDQAPAMIERAANNLKNYPQITFFCQDMQQFTTQSPYELITANFVLQWASDLTQLIRVLQHALQKQGYLCFSVPVQGSLPELQQAWSQMDTLIPVRPLFSAPQWLRALTPYFQIQQHQQSAYVEYRAQLRDLLRLFKHWGADTLPQRRQGLFGKNKWQQLQKAYQDFYSEKGYPMTFQVLTVCAQKR